MFILDIHRKSRTPTRSRSTPWLCTLCLIEIAGIGHIVINIIEVKVHRGCSLLMVPLVDLHHTGISWIDPSFEDGPIS